MSASMMPTRPPHLRERNRQVHGDGGLADAALARADRDDVLHAGHGCRAPSEPTASRTRALIWTSTLLTPGICITAARA